MLSLHREIPYNEDADIVPVFDNDFRIEQNREEVGRLDDTPTLELDDSPVNRLDTSSQRKTLPVFYVVIDRRYYDESSRRANIADDIFRINENIDKIRPARDVVEVALDMKVSAGDALPEASEALVYSNATYTNYKLGDYFLGLYNKVVRRAVNESVTVIVDNTAGNYKKDTMILTEFPDVFREGLGLLSISELDGNLIFNNNPDWVHRVLTFTSPSNTINTSTRDFDNVALYNQHELTHPDSGTPA